MLNSGCANAATGAEGLEHAERTAELLATKLETAPEHVLVCSTGPIGTRLPIERVTAALPGLVDGAGSTASHSADAARAILTTDTRLKQIVVETDGIVVGGMAKGAAMLSPNMATMLAVLTTDAAADPVALQTALRVAVAGSFNQISVDGSMSTNDTVVLLSSGRGRSVSEATLAQALVAACSDLANQMIADARKGARSG